jgi:UDP-GlcNAc:undecaprenyl-phosphate GlcNAc-1-phosphate transferase
MSFFLAMLLTLYGTPITRKVAKRYNLYDVPDGRLKTQKEPVAYLGGIIIYFAFISPIGLLFPFNQQLLGILFASSILLIVGLFDDLKALSPGIKFLFQIIATYILIKSGIIINIAAIPIWLNYSLSFLWILTVINAFNIIDIMDGLASSVGILCSLTIFVISLYNQNYVISILSVSLAGAILGFLKYNWQPARIYLGDTGSMFIGLIVGSLAIMTDYTTYNEWAFLSGFLLMSVPIFDLVYVIILRLISGKNPFFGSPDHFSLRLRKKYQLSSAQTVRIIILIQIFISTVIMINFYAEPWFSVFSLGIVLLFFCGFGLLLGFIKMTR